MGYEPEPDNRNCPNDVPLDDLRAVAAHLDKPTLEQKAGLDFGNNINGISINIMVEKSGTMTIMATYK